MTETGAGRGRIELTPGLVAILQKMQRRLGALNAATERRIDVLADRQGRLAEARRAWLEAHPVPDPCDAATIEERLLRLDAAGRIERTDAKGRVLVAARALSAYEVVLVEPWLVEAGVSEGLLDHRGRSYRCMWALAGECTRLPDFGWALLFDLADGDPGRRSALAEAVRDLAARGVRIGGGRSPEEIGALLGILRTNAFATLRAPGEVRSGIFPVTAMASHSCEPSADVHFAPGFLVVQVLRPLEEGEEITLPYLQCTLPVEERLGKLLHGYGFVCRCPRCTAALEAGEVDLDELLRMTEGTREKALRAFVRALFAEAGVAADLDGVGRSS